VLIKRADRVSAFYEAVQLAGFTPQEALGFFGRPPEGYAPKLEPLPAHLAQAAYLERFHKLLAEVGRP